MRKSISIILITTATLMGISACSEDDNENQSEEKYTTQIFARGATFNGTVSLNFSPTGEMFVIDAFSSRILKMDPENGQVLDSFTEDVDGAADLDFAPDGTLYLVAPFLGRVYKKTTDGTISRIAELNTVIDGISVNAEGRVFTASFEAGKDALWELDPYGDQPPRLVVKLGGFDAFDFGPDGYLYAPDYLNGTGQIYKINVDTGEVKVIANGFCQPISTKFNSVGELHVLDTRCSKVVKVNLATGEKTLVANVDPGADNFDFSPNDELFIAFNADSYIGKVLPDGTIYKLTKPGLSSPGSISIRPDGSLFVADAFAMRRYDAGTGEIKKSFYMNTGMIPPFTLYDDGTYIILSYHLFGGAVQIWDPDADKAVATYTDFQQPTNAIRFRGEVIVAEMGSGSVVKLNDHIPLIDGLSVPAGLVAKGDDLYVGDRQTGTIWKAVESGERLTPPRAVAKGLASPEGITFDNDGKLLVVEVDTKRLLSIALESGSVFVVAEGLDVGLKAPAGTAPTWVAMSSVAVSNSGDLYVTGDVGNVIYRIKKN